MREKNVHVVLIHITQWLNLNFWVRKTKNIKCADSWEKNTFWGQSTCFQEVKFMFFKPKISLFDQSPFLFTKNQDLQSRVSRCLFQDSRQHSVMSLGCWPQHLSYLRVVPQVWLTLKFSLFHLKPKNVLIFFWSLRLIFLVFKNLPPRCH